MKASDVSKAVPKPDADDQLQDDPYDDGTSPFLPVVYPKPGVLPGTQGCSKMSRSSSFGVSGFTWSEGRVGFTLKNNALNYTQKCSIRGGLQSPSWWNCTRFDPLHRKLSSTRHLHDSAVWWTEEHFGGEPDMVLQRRGCLQTVGCTLCAFPVAKLIDSQNTLLRVWRSELPLKCTETSVLCRTWAVCGDAGARKNSPEQLPRR